eukprot:CAMPEP_0196216116 /NCGR_PEP_ID=MMETSP0912-20130531/31505_1 /TAXON_ID=49265 /ORGANISM="Thalassiosira rotula, Strain GSO102" /LENGTH=81 /DNA_ID=CAMNT_0041493175 /DNA_START=451 /DNA_END=696 /DNA_ORIENTATION=-
MPAQPPPPMSQILFPLAVINLESVGIEEHPWPVPLPTTVRALITGGVRERLVALAGAFTVLELAEEHVVVRVVLKHAATME